MLKYIADNKSKKTLKSIIDNGYQELENSNLQKAYDSGLIAFGLAVHEANKDNGALLTECFPIIQDLFCKIADNEKCQDTIKRHISDLIIKMSEICSLDYLIKKHIAYNSGCCWCCGNPATMNHAEENVIDVSKGLVPNRIQNYKVKYNVSIGLCNDCHEKVNEDKLVRQSSRWFFIPWIILSTALSIFLIIVCEEGIQWYYYLLGFLFGCFPALLIWLLSGYIKTNLWIKNRRYIRNIKEYPGMAKTSVQLKFGLLEDTDYSVYESLRKHFYDPSKDQYKIIVENACALYRDYINN